MLAVHFHCSGFWEVSASFSFSFDTRYNYRLTYARWDSDFLRMLVPKFGAKSKLQVWVLSESFMNVHWCKQTSNYLLSCGWCRWSHQNLCMFSSHCSLLCQSVGGVEFQVAMWMICDIDFWVAFYDYSFWSIL